MSDSEQLRAALQQADQLRAATTPPSPRYSRAHLPRLPPFWHSVVPPNCQLCGLPREDYIHVFTSMTELTSQPTQHTISDH